jgi:hypothetical protein
MGPAASLTLKKPTGHMVEGYVEKPFTKGNCYAIVSIAHPGVQLFAYAMLRGDIIAKGSDTEGKGSMVTMGFCTSRDDPVRLLFESNERTSVSYRAFQKVDPQRAEMTEKLEAAKANCFRGCELQRHTCIVKDGMNVEICNSASETCRGACSKW